MLQLKILIFQIECIVTIYTIKKKKNTIYFCNFFFGVGGKGGGGCFFLKFPARTLGAVVCNKYTMMQYVSMCNVYSGVLCVQNISTCMLSMCSGPEAVGQAAEQSAGSQERLPHRLSHREKSGQPGEQRTRRQLCRTRRCK
jgi:hypothetical protein